MFAVESSTWDSLEIVKLLLSALTPIILIIIGYWINKRLTSIEHLQWASQKVIEKRLAIFDQLAPMLNDLMCYFAYIGCWKELTPVDVIKLKRRLDHIAYINAPLFPSAFLHRYNGFIHLCYKTHQGWGQDAKLRTLSHQRRKAAGTSWDTQWDACFDETDCPKVAQIRGAYAEFVAYMAEAIGVGLKAEDVLPGKSPNEIDGATK